VNPLEVPLEDKVDLFRDWTSRLLAADGVDHASGGLQAVQSGHGDIH